MIIAVVGPTGVGKTKLSIKLAKKYDAIIINFDAVQVYKELNIGSAKILEEEKEGIQHFLLDIKKPNEEYSVKEYQDDVRRILKENNNRNIVMVGGTGLYLCAALFDYRFMDDKNDYNYDDLSNDELYNLALKKDQNMTIHKNNRIRLIRFLNKENILNVEPKLLYNNVHFIGLTTNREHLYTIINNRVDKMVNDGLLEEVKDLYQKYPNSKVLHSAIGYKEIIDYIEQRTTLDDAIYLIKKKSRNYAKRQYTWFNNKMHVNWIETDYDNFDNTYQKAIELIENKTIS